MHIHALDALEAELSFGDVLTPGGSTAEIDHLGDAIAELSAHVDAPPPACSRNRSCGCRHSPAL